MAVEKNKRDNALSPVLADIILTALTILLIVIFLAVLMGMIPQFSSDSEIEDEGVPEILKITEIMGTAYCGEVKLVNVGDVNINNFEHSAAVYVDGKKKYVVINTLNAHEFIPTKHFGIQTISGSGPTGKEWRPEEFGIFNLKDGTIHRRCVLRIDIIRNSDNEIISSSEFSLT